MTQAKNSCHAGAKGERGERVGTTIPYGYMKDPDNPKHIIPDHETAPIVRRIFEMYASGIGIVRICDTLSREKVISPSVYAFRRTGSRLGTPKLEKPYYWSQRTKRGMLSNQTYCGDTVNFKTYSKSNKIRKRPDKQGEMDKYAGYLYCGECGSRLYLHRTKTLDEKKNNFMCGGYQRRSTDCTSHYIRESVLDEIVLASLRSVTAYAREHADEFYKIAMTNGEQEAKKLLKESEDRKAEYTARINQLDGIIRMLYEDRVIGRISPERYDTLAADYEKEQADLKANLKGINLQISNANLQEECIQDFIDKARQYIEMPMLTPELIRVVIKRIEVFEKAEKYSRTCGNRVIIYFTFQADKGTKIDGAMVKFGSKEETVAV